MNEIKRRPGLAGILTFLSPFAGFSYIGEPQQGLLFLSIGWILTAAGSALMLTALGMVFYIIIALLFAIYIIRRAVVIARQKQTIPRRWYNVWYVYLAMLLISGYSMSVVESLTGPFPRAFKIPSAAMEPTLQIGDHILVDQQQSSFSRGDIVVYLFSDNQDGNNDSGESINIVKRVIGLSGETVELNGTKLTINGLEIKEPYAYYVRGGMKNFGPLTVPEGKLFVLGDNRDQSRDSRYYSDPFIAMDSAIGRALYIYWNSAFDLSRIGISLTSSS